MGGYKYRPIYGSQNTIRSIYIGILVFSYSVIKLLSLSVKVTKNKQYEKII